MVTEPRIATVTSHQDLPRGVGQDPVGQGFPEGAIEVFDEELRYACVGEAPGGSSWSSETGESGDVGLVEAAGAAMHVAKNPGTYRVHSSEVIFND